MTIFQSCSERQAGRLHRYTVRTPLVVALLIFSAGCGESMIETVGFDQLPAEDTQIADASDFEDPSDVPVPSDITTPPAENDPFLAMEQDTTSKDSTAGETEATQDGDDPQLADSSNSNRARRTASDVPAQTESPADRQLSPLERMLQQRAAAIAKANGTEVPDFDEEEDTSPREIELLVPEKTFKTEGSEKAIRVSFDDLDLLKILNMAPVPTNATDHFPEWMKELHGKKVRIRGFMYPTMLDSGIKTFRMARDNDICCFVKKPKIYDTAQVFMKQGVTTDYILNLPFDVVGTFRINPREEFGELFELWRIEDATIVKR